MMSRRSWIAAFVGRALRHGRETDPDSVYDEANGRYLELRDLDPELAADSALGTRRAATPLVASVVADSPTRRR